MTDLNQAYQAASVAFIALKIAKAEHESAAKVCARASDRVQLARKRYDDALRELEQHFVPQYDRDPMQQFGGDEADHSPGKPESRCPSCQSLNPISPQCTRPFGHTGAHLYEESGDYDGTPSGG